MQVLLDVLLEDFDRWVNNVYRYQEEIRKIKRDISVGIIISMVLAMLTTIMCNMLNMFSDKTVSITDSVAYQSAAVFFVILCMSFFTYTRKHYRFDWLGKSRTDTPEWSERLPAPVFVPHFFRCIR